MGHRKANNETVAVENISCYINSKKDLLSRHYVIMPDGSEYYYLNGKLVKAEMMDFPIPELQRKAVYKGNNLDGRTNWL